LGRAQGTTEPESLNGMADLNLDTIVKAHVALSPKRPQTIHYRGDGEFMISGGTINRRRNFRPENL
jgi:hypothetical protein